MEERSGLAVSFVSASTEAHFRLLEKRQGITVTRAQVAGFESVEVAAVNLADPAGRISCGRQTSGKNHGVENHAAHIFHGAVDMIRLKA